jgi:hypothetical protein
MIGSQSPKVISHENGVLLDKNGEEIPDPPSKPRRDNFDDNECYRSAIDDYNVAYKQYQESLKDSYYQVTLTNKIFTFLESVNPETFKMIKSTLSHDNDWIDHKYVDDHGKVHVTRLIGFPACIFNSLDNEFMSEFATRTLTATPTTTQPKIEASKTISNHKSAYPFLYKKESYTKKLMQTYLGKIRDLIKQGNLQIIVPFPNLHQKFRSLEVRDMRDFNHFLELVPAFTAFHLFQRPILTIDNEHYLVSTIQDAVDAKALFDSVSATTKTSTEQKILTFYYECVRPKTNGVTVAVLTDIYNKNHRKVSDLTIRRWLDRLTSIEWVNAREGVQKDSREITYYPLQAVSEDENQAQLTDESIIISSIIKNKMILDLDVFCQLDFEKWLKTLLTSSLPTHRIMLQIDGSAIELTEEQFTNTVRCVRQHDNSSENTPKPTLETENTPTSNIIPKMIPDEMIPDLTEKPKEKAVASVTALANEDCHRGICVKCHLPQTLTYNVTYQNSSDWNDICQECGDKLNRQIANESAGANPQ